MTERRSNGARDVLPHPTTSRTRREGHQARASTTGASGADRQDEVKLASRLLQDRPQLATPGTRRCAAPPLMTEGNRASVESARIPACRRWACAKTASTMPCSANERRRGQAGVLRSRRSAGAVPAWRGARRSSCRSSDLPSPGSADTMPISLGDRFRSVRSTAILLARQGLGEWRQADCRERSAEPPSGGFAARQPARRPRRLLAETFCPGRH